MVKVGLQRVEEMIQEDEIEKERFQYKFIDKNEFN